EREEVVGAVSHSGESEEVSGLWAPPGQRALALFAVTGHPHTTPARHADVALVLGPLEEVCPLGLAPSTSTTAMIAVGDALAFVLTRLRAFTREDFARYHPAGSLGRKLLKVEAVMRRDRGTRLPSQDTPLAEVSSRARRAGAVVRTDAGGRLRGLSPDSDRARLFEQRKDAALDRPVREVMTPEPITVPLGTRLTDAVEMLSRHKISELPVVDADGRP